VHQYFGIDLRQVWETVELDMPILKAKVRKILQEINDKWPGKRSCQAELEDQLASKIRRSLCCHDMDETTSVA
jgi:hypothetical protein